MGKKRRNSQQIHTKDEKQKSDKSKRNVAKKQDNKSDKKDEMVITINAYRTWYPPPNKLIAIGMAILVGIPIITSVFDYYHIIFRIIWFICLVFLLYVSILTAMLHHRTRNLYLFFLTHAVLTVVLLSIFPMIGEDGYNIVRIIMSLLLLYVIIITVIRMISYEISFTNIDNKFEAYFLHHYSNEIDKINFYGFFKAGSSYHKYMMITTEYSKVKTITAIAKTFITGLPIAIFVQFAIATQYFIIEGVNNEILTNLIIITNIYSMIIVVAYYFYHRYYSEERLLSEMIDEQIKVLK